MIEISMIRDLILSQNRPRIYRAANDDEQPTTERHNRNYARSSRLGALLFQHDVHCTRTHDGKIV